MDNNTNNTNIKPITMSIKSRKSPKFNKLVILNPTHNIDGLYEKSNSSPSSLDLHPLKPNKNNK